MNSMVKNAISWGFLAACIGFIIHVFVSEGADLGVLYKVSLLDIIVITFLQIGQIVLGAVRYLLIVEKCCGQRIVFFSWLRIYLFARFLNLIFPQMGNLYRGLHLKKHFGITYTRYTGSFLAFAWIGITLNLAIAGAVVAVWAPKLTIGPIPAQWSLVALALIFGCAPLILDAVLRHASTHGRLFAWVRTKGSEAVGSAILAVGDSRHLFFSVVLGLASFALTCLIFHTCFSSFGIAIGVGEVALFYALLQLITYVHLTPGNFAVQEVAFALIGQQIGIGMGEAIIASALLRLCGQAALLLLAVPMGGLHALRQARSARS